ncbi:MAG: adenylate/guanylate cyclase domain-containing protein [Deltaproteobacteria bacterium]|nr:adenylate/guanylate cyclase domain-containing protein [Deltaproteobacteria bacterium]
MAAIPQFSHRNKLQAAFFLVLAVAALIGLLEMSGVFSPYRLKTLDMLFRGVPLSPASPEVVVVAVDQPDLDFFKAQGVTWPWPRQVYAPIIEFCRRAGARAVIFDILFTEASSYGPEDDARLAQAVKESGLVVLPFFTSRDRKPPNPSEGDLLQKVGHSLSGLNPEVFPHYRSLITPVPPLLAAAATLGNVECRPDADGIYRRVPLVVPYKDLWLPFLSFAAFHHFQQPGALSFESGALVLSQTRLPLDSQGQFFLKFRGPTRSHRRFAAANVIKSEAQVRHGLAPVYPLADFAGKWVLVGLTAPGLLDLKASPVGAVYPGVEVHATLLDNLLQGDFLRQAPAAALWAWAAVLAAAAVLGVLFFPHLGFTLAALAVLVGLHLGLSILAFRLSWWADPVLPGAALALSFGLAAAYSYATEGRQKRFIRGMFGQYMSETVINHLLQHPEKLKLGGERRRVTLFFSDLAGFTTLSERLPPETVVGLLNDYLSRMTEIILQEEGTVDKFEGDAIMAFWGAPLDQEDQAVRACQAALSQTAALRELNREFAHQGLPELKLRIGIHTGEAIVGNLGSQKRFDYTVIGDTVNLASRLEGLNKFYATAIMASEVAVADCGGEIEFRELDLVAVKGREAPVRVFEVLAPKGKLTPAQAAVREDFIPGLELYRRGRFEAAAARFTHALSHFPEDGPAQVFLNRCREFQAAPPPPDWDTVFRPDAK